MNIQSSWRMAEAISRRGQVAGPVIAVMVAIIIIVAVALPVVQNVVDESGQTGTTGTILQLLPLFIGLAALVVVASMFA